MEVRSFFREEGVALERMLCSMMEAAVVETALVAEKSVFRLLLEVFFSLEFGLEAVSTMWVFVFLFQIWLSS